MADPARRRGALVVSINTSWNIVNFRRNLVERLLREGYDVVAVSPADGHEAALKRMGVRHIAIDIDRKGLSPWRDLLLVWRYWRVLGAVRPVAYLGWTIKPNIYGSMAARVRGIPVINNISGLGTAFISEGLLTRLVRRLYRLALAGSSTVFFQNRHDRELFVERRIVARARTDLLPGSGIDLRQFAPDAAAAPLDRTRANPIFLMVARVLRDKGVVEFAEAARIIRADRPDVEFHLLGSFDTDNRTAIPRAMIDAWERDGTLRYLKPVDDVRPFLAGATAVVLPSYREGMPRSLLEAAAMGRPLIATDVPGCTDIARAGENAFLCPPRDANALASAISAFLDLNPDTIAAMGRRSRAIAEADFDVALIESRYLDAIDRALGASPALQAEMPRGRPLSAAPDVRSDPGH